jgi:hypothetical protein
LIFRSLHLCREGYNCSDQMSTKKRKRIDSRDDTLAILANKRLTSKIRDGIREIDAGRAIPLASVKLPRLRR